MAEDLVDRGITTPTQLGIAGRQQRRPADGRHADPRTRSCSARWCAGAAAGHAALPPAAGRRVVDGRVRRPRRSRRLGVHLASTRRTRTSRRTALSAGADHHLHPRRPRAPGHARKMVGALEEPGHDVLYYENIEGGHGGAADNAQPAFKSALWPRVLVAHAGLGTRLRPTTSGCSPGGVGRGRGDRDQGAWPGDSRGTCTRRPRPARRSPAMTVLDLPPAAPDSGRSADIAPACRVGGSSTVVGPASTVATARGHGAGLLRRRCTAGWARGPDGETTGRERDASLPSNGCSRHHRWPRSPSSAVPGSTTTHCGTSHRR